MDPCTISVGISALACAISGQISNADDLALLSAFFVQLGDTLATISAARAVCPCANNSEASGKN